MDRILFAVSIHENRNQGLATDRPPLGGPIGMLV